MMKIKAIRSSTEFCENFHAILFDFAILVKLLFTNLIFVAVFDSSKLFLNIPSIPLRYILGFMLSPTTSAKTKDYFCLFTFAFLL